MFFKAVKIQYNINKIIKNDKLFDFEEKFNPSFIDLFSKKSKKIINIAFINPSNIITLKGSMLSNSNRYFSIVSKNALPKQETIVIPMDVNLFITSKLSSFISIIIIINKQIDIIIKQNQLCL